MHIFSDADTNMIDQNNEDITQWQLTSKFAVFFRHFLHW